MAAIAMKISGESAAVEIPRAAATVEIATSEVAAVTETTATAAKMAAAPAAHTKAATAAMAASAAFGEGVMGDRDAADSENRHDGRNFVQD